jgi:Uma2 family endonuclease
MLITKPRFQTFAEYLQYEDNSDDSSELFNEKLVELPPESGLNFQIANFLFLTFASLVGHRRVRGHRTWIGEDMV